MFKKRGFTDKLYFLNLTLSWLFIIICILITLFSGKLGITDLSIVSVGLPAVFAELGIHTGFIIWKAKTENISKFGYDPDNGREVTIEPKKEETDDSNTIHCDADVGCGSDLPSDRSNQESVSKFRERLLGKSRRFN
jgi:hypothetical protein